jgi:hypothetical protein
MFVQDGFLYLIVTKHKLTVQYTGKIGRSSTVPGPGYRSAAVTEKKIGLIDREIFHNCCG